MATEPLQVYSGKRILLEYYNRVNQKNLHLNDVQFGVPLRVETAGTNFNTTIRLYPNLGTPFYGSPRLDYDRIHVSQLGVIVVAKGSAVRVHDLLPAINDKYNINLSADDVENDLLPAVSGNVTVNLTIKPGSVLFYDGAIIYTPNYPDPANQPLPQVDDYAYWSAYRSSQNVVIGDNDRSALMNYEHTAITQLPITEGRVYWEIKIDTGSLMIGIGRPDTPRASSGIEVLGHDETNWVLNTATGKLHHNGAIYNYTNPIVAGSTVGVLYDYNAGILSYIVGNQQLGAAFTNLPSMPEVYPVISGALTSNSKGTGNFGDQPMFYAVPSGYKSGLYTLVPVGGSTPPPPGSGGGTGTNPPAGTLLGSFCQDGDFWLVTATGNGGFTIVLTESNSTQCGYDDDDIPIIDGGDSSSGGVPNPTLSVVASQYSVDEGASVDLVYNVAGIRTQPLSLVFNRAFQTANDTDISLFEFKSDSGSAYETITDGETIVIPATDTVFHIRAHIVADLTTEGSEVFTVILQEPVLQTILSNTTPLITPVVINDTSVPYTPTAIITTPSGAVETDEASNTIVTFALTEALPMDLFVRFRRILGTATDSDIEGYQSSINLTTWSTITHNSVFTIPAGATNFYIRVIADEDLTTEGDETITISCEEEITSTPKLADPGPVTKLVTIKDTSVSPILYPENPLPPAGFSGGQSFDFETDYGNEFEMGETSGSSSITWQP